MSWEAALAAAACASWLLCLSLIQMDLTKAWCPERLPWLLLPRLLKQVLTGTWSPGKLPWLLLPGRLQTISDISLVSWETPLGLQKIIIQYSQERIHIAI